jgi:hypothetical protein
MASSTTSPAAAFLCVDSFADKQFNNVDAIPMGKEEFTVRINELYEEAKAKQAAGATDTAMFADGYAPFCKHFFVPNFVGAHATSVKITSANEHLLRTRYEARTDGELPVLIRYFPAGSDEVKPPEAKFLDLILYSREQVTKEVAAMGKECSDTAPWAVVSVKPQLTSAETPMQPMTAMRNALGVEHGGSSVPIDRDEYLKSVAFWKNHATFAKESK